MASRRSDGDRAASRERLIDAAAQLINEEGHAAVTAGRLAKMVGLKRQSVHYYFGTIDDLIIAVIRKNMDAVLQADQDAMDSDDPLRTLWELSSQPLVAAPVFEFIAIALRSEAVAAEMKRFGEMLRSVQLRAIERHFQRRGVEPAVPAVVPAILLPIVAYHLAFEQRMGMSLGHEELRAYIDSWIDNFGQGGRPTDLP